MEGCGFIAFVEGAEFVQRPAKREIGGKCGIGGLRRTGRPVREGQKRKRHGAERRDGQTGKSFAQPSHAGRSNRPGHLAQLRQNARRSDPSV
jgi:hypothetical protein